MSETSAEAPATDPPGEKVYICPACGTRYDEPTTCANGHPPAETVEYDRATVAAAESGDEDAQAAIAEQATEQAGTSAGAVAGEATTAAPVGPDDPGPAAAPPADDPAGDAPSSGTPPGGATDQSAQEAGVSGSTEAEPVEPPAPADVSPAEPETKRPEPVEMPATADVGELWEQAQAAFRALGNALGL
jgi:hypothetical protein